MANKQHLSELSGERTIAGAKQLRKAIASGRASRVYLAQNADPAITEPIVTLCQENAVSVLWVPSMSELGQACNIDVGTAAAAIIR